MQDFRGKHAVITGAASGLGRGLAEHCLQEGMKVVLADVEEQALAQTAQALRAAGGTVLAVPADVSKAEDVEALARQACQTFGAVHLLFNNAGVTAGSSIWESSLEDWQWVLGVNLWGVIHGLRVFVPIMLAQPASGHIVNTASVVGFLPASFPESPPLPDAPYHLTKHAIIALSDHLYHSLAQRKADIGVSVLCSGWVNTRIVEAERNRPAEYQNATSSAAEQTEREAVLQRAQAALKFGMSPRQVAEQVFRAIRARQFYILTHPEFLPVMRRHADGILKQRNPTTVPVRF